MAAMTEAFEEDVKGGLRKESKRWVVRFFSIELGPVF